MSLKHLPPRGEAGQRRDERPGSQPANALPGTRVQQSRSPYRGMEFPALARPPFKGSLFSGVSTKTGRNYINNHYRTIGSIIEITTCSQIYRCTRACRPRFTRTSVSKLSVPTCYLANHTAAGWHPVKIGSDGCRRLVAGVQACISVDEAFPRQRSPILVSV